MVTSVNPYGDGLPGRTSKVESCSALSMAGSRGRLIIDGSRFIGRRGGVVGTDDMASGGEVKYVEE